MKKTILCHFYNEEYLLPWFLKHHRQIFDHGIMIDYHSTDRSVEIIKELCPTWDIVKTRNSDFGAFEVDQEVIDIESQIEGWKMCLNVTEHLIGNYSILDDTPNKQILVPSMVFVDTDRENLPDHNRPLYEQKTSGYLDIYPYTHERPARSLHNYNIHYLYSAIVGRHFYKIDLPIQLIVFHYGYCPWNEDFLKRKMQIQHKIPQSNYIRGLGKQHIGDQELFEKKFTEKLPRAKYLSEEINYFTSLHNATKRA